MARTLSTKPKSVQVRTWQRKRYAERTIVGGLQIHPYAPHGQLRSYSMYGCRGPMCYTTFRHYRETGETSLPEIGSQQYGPDDCLAYRSDVYEDRRART